MPEQPSRAPFIAATAAAVLAGGFVGYVIGRRSASKTDRPEEDTAPSRSLRSRMRRFEQEQDDGKLVSCLQQEWAALRLSTRVRLIGLDEHSPRMLGCLLEAAWGAEQKLASGDDSQICKPTVAPRLPKYTVQQLRESWRELDKDAFVTDFFDRLYSEPSAEKLRQMFACAIARPGNWPKFIELILSLLDAEFVPRLERLMHAVAALAHQFGQFQLCDVAPIKRSLIRSLGAMLHGKEEKRRLIRSWEALCYTLAASAAPYLAMASIPVQFAAAVAAPLPTPGGGPQAAATGACGVALMEMCLGITSQSPRPANGSLEEELDAVMAKLATARHWLLDCVRDDVNAYCGLLATVFGKPPMQVLEAPDSGGMAEYEAEEAERRRWLRRATEVPLRVAEVCLAVASSCAPHAAVKESLKGDWVAGSKFLHAAVEVSIFNVEINRAHVKDKFAAEVDVRVSRLKEQQGAEAPWEALCAQHLNG